MSTKVYIFKKDEEVPAPKKGRVYCIKNGQVKVVRYLQNGNEAVLDIRKEGEYLYELETFGINQPCNYVTLNDVTLEEVSVTGFNLIEFIINKYYFFHKRMELLWLNNARDRIEELKQLYDLSLLRGAEVAGLAGVTRETVSRARIIE